MSKELFLEMREEQMATMYSHDFTKSKAIQTGETLVANIFENGNVDPVHAFSNIARLKTVIDIADKAFRERLDIGSETSWNGVKFTPKSGAKKLNYDEDDIYKSLSEKLKNREKLLKTAHESKDVIFDSEGCEVPKVTATFNKSSITITF